MTIDINTNRNAQYIGIRHPASGFFANDTKEKETALSKICSNRFDTLDIKRSLEKFAGADKAADTDLRKMIADIKDKEDIDKEKDAEIRRLYGEIQEHINRGIYDEKCRIERFSDLLDEKGYYNDLLSSSDGDMIVIKEGRYSFKNTESGTVMDRESVERLLDQTQRHINSNLIPAKTKDQTKAGNIAGRYFESMAERLSGLWESEGVYCSELNNTAFDDLFDISGRTEENFFEKAYERIDRLKAYSEGLKLSLKEYDDLLEAKRNPADEKISESYDRLMTDVMRKKMSDAETVIDQLA